MAIESVALRYASSLTTVGKIGLNIAYPKEFEIYLCALELTDENFNTLQYFIFPVMPSNIDETQTFIPNIKKTLAGVTVLNTPTFIPRDITLAGTFGRKFRVLLGQDYSDLANSFKTTDGNLSLESVWSGAKQFFDNRIKTGYGCIKILEEIINSVNIIDDLGARKLILHNPAIGNSYLVKPINLKQSQTQETNMIWSYSLSLKAIASLEHIMESEELKQQRIKLNTTGYIQKATDNVIDGLTNLLANV